mgnify:CR=1 FL=1
MSSAATRRRCLRSPPGRRRHGACRRGTSSILRLPPWIAIHIADTTVFGFGNRLAERTVFSEELMNRELEASSETFASCAGLKILVGHHPIFTAGKRTILDNGDGELLCMRRLRRGDRGLRRPLLFQRPRAPAESYGRSEPCEHIIQGCGGARLKPNLRHRAARRRLARCRKGAPLFRGVWRICYCRRRCGSAAFAALPRHSPRRAGARRCASSMNTTGTVR